VRALLRTQLTLICFLLSSCVILGAPPNEEADFNEQLNMTWGPDGAFCQMTFGDRVSAAEAPAFIAAQEKKCAEGDAMACRDEADARMAGCVGTPQDRDRGMALLLRACDLGHPEACRGYIEDTPSRRWLVFPNRDRQRAQAREVELLEKYCGAGDRERCRMLDRRRRAGP